MYERTLALNRMFGGGDRQMRFISGPRQSGKTTLAKTVLRAKRCDRLYFNWDDRSLRRRLRDEPDFLWSELRRQVGGPKLAWVCMDEIHKASKWRDLLKGWFDRHEREARFLVTGSARLEWVRRAGDSLAGRYFLFHLYPLTLREALGRPRPIPPSKDAARWVETSADKGRFEPGAVDSLMRFGAFPEPFARQSAAFVRKWHESYIDLLVREDLRDLSRIADLDSMAALFELLPSRIGSPLSLNSLRGDLAVSHTAIRHYVVTLALGYVLFEIRPWASNIARSIKKERKVYLFDWTDVPSEAARFENMVAHELLALTAAWNDAGLGRFELRYVRTRLGKETDFLIVSAGRPWLLIETKLSDQAIDSHHRSHAAALGGIPVIQVCRSDNVLRRESPRSYRLSASRLFSAAL